MTETLTPSAALPPSFAGRRFARTATALASSGLLVGMGAVSASPAVAAEEADCDASNTVDATDTGTAADIQTLLDANTAIVCLAGSFTLASSLTFDHNLELFGLDGAELDGDSLTRMLTGSGGASLSVQNISFIDGSAVVGGAISVDGELLVEDSQFTDNSSVEDGGAIFVDGANVVEVVGSTFTANATGPEVGGDGYSGGAIFAVGTSAVFVSESTFTGNEASELGGAIAGYTVIAELSEFSDNAAPFGGAIYGFAVVGFESTFAGNSAEEGGAIRGLAYGASLGSTFVDNDATAYGGAIAAGVPEGMNGYGGVISLNSTFVENTAAEVGGALVGQYGQVALSTFLDNEADAALITERSDAIWVFGDEEPMEIGGSIFAGSRPTAQLGSAFDDSYADLGGNVFSTAQSAESALGTPDPSTTFGQPTASIFGAGASLGDNGGPTQTLALVAGSPAVDAVPESTLALLPTAAEATFAPAQERLDAVADLIAASDTSDVDQRSEPRVGAFVDAGAFELQADEIGSEGELADTGAADTKVLGGFAALLLGIGAAFAIGTRRLSRDGR